MDRCHAVATAGRTAGCESTTTADTRRRCTVLAGLRTKTRILPPSLRSPAQQHFFYRLESNEQVERHRDMLDVVKVVSKLFLRLFERGTIVIAHLGPAGNSRTNSMAQVVVRDLLLEPLDKFRSFWARTDEPHVSNEHVPQLRNFIEPCGT